MGQRYFDMKVSPTGLKKGKFGRYKVLYSPSIQNNLTNFASYILCAINDRKFQIWENRLKKIFLLKKEINPLFVKLYKPFFTQVSIDYEGEPSFALLLRKMIRFLRYIKNAASLEPKAEKEAVRIFEAYRKGIPTILPVAVFARRKFLFYMESFLVFHYDKNVVQVDEAFKNESTIAGKRKFLRQYAEFVRKIHSSGVYQDDFTVTNTLVKKENGNFVFALVDFERTKILSAPLSFEQRIKNFVKLSNSIEITDKDKFLFLWYYKKGKLSNRAGRKFMEKFNEIEKTYLKHYAIKIKRQCLQANRNYGYLKFPKEGIYGYIRKNDTDEKLLHAMKKIMLHELKRKKNIKKRNIVIGKDALRYDLGESSISLFLAMEARNIWVSSNILYFSGIPSFKPLGFFDVQASIPDNYGIVFFKNSTHTVNVYEELAEKENAEQKILLTQIANLLGKYHRRGFYSEKFSPNYILYDRQNGGVLLSPFAELKVHGELTSAQVGDDLLKIMAALTECGLSMFQKKLFLRAYLRQYRLSKQTEEEFAHLLARNSCSDCTDGRVLLG